jgi:hypothetical protein
MNLRLFIGILNLRSLLMQNGGTRQVVAQP